MFIVFVALLFCKKLCSKNFDSVVVLCYFSFSYLALPLVFDELSYVSIIILLSCVFLHFYVSIYNHSWFHRSIAVPWKNGSCIFLFI